MDTANGAVFSFVQVQPAGVTIFNSRGAVNTGRRGDGDPYFRVHRPNHNLDRARTQFKLVESIEKHEEAMQKFADSI